MPSPLIPLTTDDEQTFKARWPREAACVGSQQACLGKAYLKVTCTSYILVEMLFHGSSMTTY